MAFEKIKKGLRNRWFLIAMVFLGIIFLLSTTSPMSIFYTGQKTFSVLPTGQYRSNADCTFLTNVPEGQNYYGNSDAWISLNAEGMMDGYGYAGYSSFSCTQNGAVMLPIETIEGYDLCTRSGYTGRVYLREGTNGVIFKTDDPAAIGAITSCGDVGGTTSTTTLPTGTTSTTVTCTPTWSCTSWSSCSNNVQIRDCTDIHYCGTNQGKPATSQSCSTTCAPDWEVGDWSDCTNGQQTRECVDNNVCNVGSCPDTTTQSCNGGGDIGICNYFNWAPQLGPFDKCTSGIIIVGGGIALVAAMGGG